MLVRRPRAPTHHRQRTGPADPGLLGCDIVDGGWCLAGLLGDEGARFSLRHHAPSGVWTTTARGHGCPTAACAREVGRAQAHVGPRSPLVVNHPAEVEYTLSCAALPGRPALPMARDPHSDAVRPAWLVDCLDGQPLRLDPLGNGRWSIGDARPDPVVIEGGRIRRVTGVERAGWVAQFMACTQRACAAANTWDEPWGDPDRDGVQSRCDVCPDRPDPGQPDGDGDRVGDTCDLCPADFDPWQTDGDGDGRGDVCDVCPEDADPEQADSDSDGVGDVCDVCPARADPWQPDGDGDGVGDRCDVCPDEPDPAQPDGDGDGAGDVCDVCPAAADPSRSIPMRTGTAMRATTMTMTTG